MLSLALFFDLPASFLVLSLGSKPNLPCWRPPFTPANWLRFVLDCSYRITPDLGHPNCSVSQFPRNPRVCDAFLHFSGFLPFLLRLKWSRRRFSVLILGKRDTKRKLSDLNARIQVQTDCSLVCFLCFGHNMWIFMWKMIFYAFLCLMCCLFVCLALFLNATQVRGDTGYKGIRRKSDFNATRFVNGAFLRVFWEKIVLVRFKLNQFWLLMTCWMAWEVERAGNIEKRC